jgi:Family of unknown function (DUF5343)
MLSHGARIAKKEANPLAEKHPYASPGAVTAAINQFRKSFPANVTADTLRKLSIAPNNESYVINTLRFISAIDAEGNKTAKSTAAFNQHGDPAFQQAFGDMVKVVGTGRLQMTRPQRELPHLSCSLQRRTAAH